MLQSFGLFGVLISLIGLLGFFKMIWAVSVAVRVALTLINSEWASKYGIGTWAVVTGCTEGIGKAFCPPLARVGFNLCLVSRNRTKLEDLERQLKANHPNLKTKIVVADFSEYSQQLFDRIVKETSELDVSLLINNVGIATKCSLWNQTTSEIETQINVNVNTIAHLTHRLISKMLLRKHRSGIINISSTATQLPVRTISVYAGGKGFDDIFSRSLSEDCVGTKIDVVSCRPAIVATAGTNYTNDPMASSAESCAIGTLKALGKVNITAGSFYHVVQNWFLQIIGESIAKKVGDFKIDGVGKNK